MGDAPSAVGRAVEEVRSALNQHADVVAELFGRVSTDLRSGFAPALDSFLGFFHAVDWKVRLHPPSAANTSSLLACTRSFPRTVSTTITCVWIYKAIKGMYCALYCTEYPQGQSNFAFSFLCMHRNLG
jgi:hypothetical protein